MSRISNRKGTLVLIGSRARARALDYGINNRGLKDHNMQD